jgi:vacuolar protein sorting-associated protein 8
VFASSRNLLWQELWERLHSPDLYLNLLSQQVENDEIRVISPAVAQALCEYWANISSKKLEELILKIDWQCLDLHQVLTLARKEQLFKAQMYLNTKALGDYTASLTDLIPLINEGEERALGNCVLVYISSCLAGRGYPTGEIEPIMVPTVKHEVLRCLTVPHSKSAGDDELMYPYLRELLKFDTRETLNVISLAFQEPEFNGELGLSHRQRIINVLMEILTPDYATVSF